LDNESNFDPMILNVP